MMLNDVDIFVLHPLQMSWHMLTHYFQVLDPPLLWFNPIASILITHIIVGSQIYVFYPIHAPRFLGLGSVSVAQLSHP